MKIKQGGQLERLQNRKLESLDVFFDNGQIQLWINDDSVSYLSVEEAIQLRNNLNDALMSYILKGETI